MISSVNATIVTYNSSEDTYSNQNQADTNKATETHVQVGRQDGQKQNGYWKFIIDIPTKQTIKSGIVYLWSDIGYATGTNKYPINHTVWSIKNYSWVEEDITWNNGLYDNINRLLTFKTYDSVINETNQQFYGYDITSLVEEEYYSNHNNISIFMNGTPDWDITEFIRYKSKENETFIPYLQIEYLPQLQVVDFSQLNYIRQFGKILHNHNTCIDTETLGHNITYQITIDQNQSIVNMWVTEPCEFGCDNSTMTCKSSPSSEYVTYALILLIIGIIIIAFVKVAKR
jgi:hypothetical protein